MHSTITPITDITGALRFVTVIFAAKEDSPEWSLGIVVFAKWDPDDDFDICIGKRHTGLSLLLPAEEKEIAANQHCYRRDIHNWISLRTRRQ